MAETLSSVRPSEAIYNTLVTSTTYPISKLYDTNDTDYAYTGADSTGKSAILSGFDFSSIPDNATITNISVSIKGRAGNSSVVGLKASLVKNGTSIGVYTDLGDSGSQFFEGTSTTAKTIDYPVATSVCTVQFLKNNGLQLRLYGCTGSARIYYAYVNVTYEVPVNYTITVNAGAGGTVAGGGTYETGSAVTLTATPDTGYKFKQWSDGVTTASRTVTVAKDVTYTAQFEKLTYTLSVSADPTAGGTITGGGTYEYGSTVTLTAKANGGYAFVAWADGNTSNPRSVTVTVNSDYTAIFEESQKNGIFIDTQPVTVQKGTVFLGSAKF